MEKITIDVLKTDILLGKQDVAKSCAIARAAKRQGLQNVSVDSKIEFTRGSKHFEGKLPTRIVSWIEKFDNGTKSELATKPFSFSVQVKEVA